MSAPNETPDIVALLRPEVESLPAAARPAFLARLERQAGRRYRAWADAAKDPVVAAGLRVCASREEGIAEMIEAAFPAPSGSRADLDAALARIASQLAGLAAGSGGADLLRAFAGQAAAERAGARTWRGLIDSAETDEQRWTLEACARLETESADFLDAVILRLGGPLTT